jgi:hypothetical protein
MLDHDPLAAQFVQLRATVLTQPPGPAAAAQTVRRRRQYTAVVASSLAVVAVAALGVTAASLATPPRQGSTTAWPGLTDGAAPTATAPEQTPAASRSAGRPVLPTLPDLPNVCRRLGAVTLDVPLMNTVSVRVDPAGPYPLCPGEQVRVFVATYSVDAGGVQHLYKSQVSMLDSGHNPLTLSYSVPPCHTTIYVISGNQPIRATIPAMASFYQEAGAVYSTPAAGPYGGVIWLQEQDPCLATGRSTGPQ